METGLPKQGRRGRDTPRLPVRTIEIRNFLSLVDVKVNLNPFNVLVGPNGAGKSNFLSVFRLLGEVARTDLVPALELFGGYDQARFHGNTKGPIEIALKGQVTEHASVGALDEYTLRFKLVGSGALARVLQRDENILLKRRNGQGRRFSLNGTRYEIETVDRQRAGTNLPVELGHHQSIGKISADASALSVLRRIGEEADTRQIGQLADMFENLRLFDPSVDKARLPVSVRSATRLAPDASNLAAVLLTLNQEAPTILRALEHDVQRVLPGFRSFRFDKVGGAEEAVTVSLVEEGLRTPTPLARASFGTVRAIALFTMLRDLDPPKLTCLEEVDHGLHPHALDILVDRLREASSRTQIIVATHSPAFVNRVGNDELIIFERDRSGRSNVIQIDPEELREMQERSELRLGELWFSGTIGGIPE